MMSEDDLKLVLFDFDGTLCDSATTIIRLMKQACHDLGLSEPSTEQIRGNIGYGVAEAAMDYAAGDYHKAVELADHYRQLSRAEYSSGRPVVDPLFDGAEDCLASLSEGGYLLGVATNKSRPPLISLLEHHQIIKYFDVIMTVDDTAAKPSGEMAREALRRTGVDNRSAILVGDTIIDAGCASDAAIGFLGAGWGYHSNERLTEKGAFGIADDFQAIADMVSDYFSQR